MTPARRSVLVAMSGGVDSSVASALLVEAGHEVVGVTLKLHDAPAAGGSDRGCCTVADADDARAVAGRLGIPCYVLDLSEEFAAGVVAPYVAAHAAGRTPNPCVECNRRVKFTEILARADALGIDAVATGHHARLEGGRLLRGRDMAKDQSYVLACLPHDVLARTLLPVGELTKADVRAVAGRLGLRTAAKAESMEACFLPAGREKFLGRRLGLAPGPVLDGEGALVGRHRGAPLYTLGQRRGVGVALGARAYVRSVDVVANTVTVTAAPPRTAGLRVGAVTWLRRPAPGGVFGAHVQTRAHGAAVRARCRAAGDGVEVGFEVPAEVAAPGQFAAFYEGDEVVAGGEIVHVDLAPPTDRLQLL